jgi:ACT domain-containing protein
MDEVVAVVKNLAAEVANNTQQLKALSHVLADIQQKQATVLTVSQSGAYQAQINTAISVLLGQQTLQGAPVEIIETALNDLPEILAILGKAQQPGRK